MPFGELHHGELGSLQDLASLLGMEMGSPSRIACLPP